jgi:hypothetical protein
MKIAPYLDPDGIARERERAAYRVVLLHGSDRLCLGFMPEREGLSCLEFVPVFALALKPDTSPETARHLGDLMVAHMEGLEAVYRNPDEPEPGSPKIVRLRAA